MSLRDQIIGARDLREQTVAVPEWGGPVLLVEMDGATRLSFDDESAALKADGRKEDGMGLAARLLVRCIHDPETRERVFADDDAPKVMKKNPKVLMRLFRVAAALNTATEKEVESEAGKSAGAPSAG